MEAIDIIIKHNIIGTFKNPINSGEQLRVVGYRIENGTMFLDIKVDEAMR